MKHLLLIIFIAVFASACSVQNDETDLKGPVNDQVGLLSADVVREMNESIESFEKKTCHQIAILVVDSTNGESIEAFSLKAANKWGIGYKGLDNGVLVTLAMNSKRLRVEVGRGLTNYLTDEEAARIIDQDIVPKFKDGNFPLGLKQGLISIMKAASLYEIPENQRPIVCKSV